MPWRGRVASRSRRGRVRTPRTRRDHAAALALACARDHAAALASRGRVALASRSRRGRVALAARPCGRVALALASRSRRGRVAAAVRRPHKRPHGRPRHGRVAAVARPHAETAKREQNGNSAGGTLSFSFPHSNFRHAVVSRFGFVFLTSVTLS